MRIKTIALCSYLEKSMAEDLRISVRCSYLLTTLCEGLEKQNLEDPKNEIELYDLLTCLIFLADKIPAECIVDLLTLVTYEHSFDVLKKNTVQKSAEFLRDYLKAASSRSLLS